MAASIAAATDVKAAYIRNKAFDDGHYKKMIEAFLQKFKTGTRQDFEILITEKLSDVLTERQKKDKVKNILQAMKREGRIRLNGKNWELP